MTDFPDYCLRGIPNNDFVDEDGTVATHLFKIDKNFDDRDCNELSINWEDDEVGSLESLLTQTKSDGAQQFKAGAVKISRKDLNQLKNSEVGRKSFDYERAALTDNEYHGNLLLCIAGLSKTGKKKKINKVAAALAVYASEVIPSPPTKPT